MPEPVEPPQGGHPVLVVAKPSVPKAVQALVAKALQDKTCRDFITGGNPAGGDSAELVWKAVTVKKSDTPDPDEPNANANARVNVVGAGTNGEITVYPSFFEEITELSIVNEFDRARLTRSPTLAEAQAAVLLHEVAHLTGGVGHTTPEANSHENAAILEACLKIPRWS